MSLRLKSLLIFAGTITLLFAIVVMLAEVVIERQFTELEIDKMLQQADRFSFDLKNELRPILWSLGEWGQRHNAVDLAKEESSGSSRESPSTDDLASLQLDFLFLWQPNGTARLIQANTSLLQANGLSVDTLQEAISREHFLPQAESRTGFLRAGDRLILAAALPIVAANLSTPAGTLVGGRIFGQTAVSTFEQESGYQFQILFPKAAPAQTKPNIALLRGVQILDPQRITATVPVLGVGGDIIAYGELASVRPMHIQAGRTIGIFLVSLAACGGILLFVVWYLLDSNVIYPVQRLSARLAAATAQGRLPTDLGFKGGDELAQLARSIEVLANAVMQSEASYRRLFETATEGILVVKQSNRIILDANPELCRLLETPREQLVGQAVENVAKLKGRKTLRTLAKLLDGRAPARDTEISLPGETGRRYLEISTGFYDIGGDSIMQLNFRDISRRRQANDELRALSGRLMRSQDEERRRIARELHDSTAQNLSALQMAATQLRPNLSASHPGAVETLEEIRSLTDLSLREVRTISYLLHPPLLDEVGLLFALRWYVDGFMTRTEKIVRLDVPETLERLPHEIETTIFRIVQEGLSNVHRHSGSRRAWIRLALEEGVLTLEIRDEGRGFPPDGKQGAPGVYPVVGVGIAGMRERLRQFNGSLSIESNSHGTTVRATLPIEPDEPEED